MSKVSDARAKYHDDAGDALAMRALEAARAMQEAHGYRRVAKPAAFTGSGARPAPQRVPGVSATSPGGDEQQTALREQPIRRPGPGWGDVGSGPRKSWRDPRPIGDALSTLVTTHGWRRQLAVAGVVSMWENIVGPQLAPHCWIESFEESVLTLRTSSTSWAVQIRTLLPQLKKRIVEEIGEDVVSDIVVRGPDQRNWKHGRFSVPGRGPRDTYG